MEDGKITIFDVAERAGVSKGTVDRVLHNRGEVSAKSAAKVRKAIEELGYQPNLYASLLATRNAHVIACLLPEFAPGEYWERINDGMVLGGKQVASLNVLVRAFYYDQYDARSFRSACAELLASKPSGVVLPPLFMSDTLNFVQELQNDGIPYVYIDSKLEEDNYFAYYGMPMYRSGHLCAALLTERVAPEDVDEVAVIRINRDKNRQSDPTVSRRAGFMDYMAANFPECRINSLFINPSDEDGIYAALDEFFSEHGDLRYVVMFNSRVHLLNRYLEDHPVPGRRVIAFDNLDKNMQMLRDGHLSILISQHTEHQSRDAVVTLANYILMRQKPATRDNFMHMDILTRYNQENY